ncbi:MAG: VOC family protein [Planctomycetaceae bacterium]
MDADAARVLFVTIDALPTLCVQRVPEPKAAKTRIHLDLGVDGLEGTEFDLTLVAE